MTLPIARTCPFDPPAELRDKPAVSRLRFADGTLGWMVTTHAESRTVLTDPRFSARGELVRSPIRPVMQPAAPGAFAFMDPPDHTHYRKLLTGQFTVRRMRILEPRIEQITKELLDAMTPPTDLVQAFALPLPSRVICELLGVPYTDHEFFEQKSHDMVDPKGSHESRGAAGEELFGYLHQLVQAKRAAPDDALISGLLGQLDDVELTGMAIMLLFAGHETTANMLGLGTFALLQHPEQLAKLHDDVDAAVEELLRYLSIVQYEVNRTALADVELGGEVIKKGETVLVSLPAANRDKFERPDELDVTRSTAGHLAFGHGVHQCLGQQLARIEMRVGFSALFTRFPTLRLAVDPADVPLNVERGIYGVASLPVTW
ncbi:cytochrome P450 [Kibdelosporangium philippinense]|uniref:Cytochrome P450 n=1 Tax=Kibdelosporangium philippinense TaxID=211113 RepID=A0ABS8ZVA7_9PSEU|nr:cytochrome P450 [Kibdelosporangium philippinense]MCE7011188.1 cytochrome P450 [Kibdelosporangium philippinense]